MDHLQGRVKLHNGVEMPGFGLGVYKVSEGQEVELAVSSALEYGYRMIDTATVYQNETGVGRVINQSNISRDDLFITTKVWNDDQGYDETLRAFESSLEKLKLDFVDLYLIHWPVKNKYKETWKALERLYDEKAVRAIGVSNFHVHHLENVMSRANIKPMVNQIEYHPHLTQQEVKTFCEKEQIQLEAWSPLKRGRLLDEPTIVELANKYDKTPAQIILRWDLQTGVVTIPKSVNPTRIKENANIFDFELSQEDIERLTALNKNERSGTNPDKYDEE
ncbi:aldo/keto reductase [Bacillaceae bacterium W0354]